MRLDFMPDFKKYDEIEDLPGLISLFDFLVSHSHSHSSLSLSLSLSSLVWDTFYITIDR
jgi:hypothetical protein